MKLPLSDHEYGEHGAVLPPQNHATHDGADIDLAVRTGIYRKLQEMRQFESRAYDLFMRQLVKGTSHLSLGMEAIAAGFGAAMRCDDYTFATYRGHAHTLARGVPMTPVMAELLGRSNGLMSGKGGSMHLTSVEHGMMGSYAIIGAHLTIANGAAWSAQYRGTGQVAVCFFGDGTTNIGAFHEALNYAAVYRLPVVFVCENNLYMEYTAIADITAVQHPAADRASAYGLGSQVIDGNDADAVYLAASAAIERARAGEGPSLVEALTYRHGGHSRADPGKYRPEHEVAAWKAYDPIPLYRARLVRLGVEEAELDLIDKEVAGAVDLATEEAIAGDLPSPESAFTDVWADGGSSWRN
jgi:pyruvate dehydrogenase E1 component alpha subunit